MERVKTLLPTEAAYLAGLIDGEGYVAVTAATTSKSAKRCKRGAAVRVTVAVRMTTRRPLDWAAALTGFGRVTAPRLLNPKHKQPYQWQIWSRQAVEVLVAIRPYLKVKDRQADLCTAFQARMRLPGKLGLSDEEWNFRLDCWSRSKELNRNV